ncbi:MAG: DPP IV N-terminal domain-containing protein, partial [Bacteroidetes bacterium]|nr:DPP IV N-terminal domain-containing protein [Bacteroidota bacterium]
MRSLFTFFILIIGLEMAWGQNTPITQANYSLAARFSPDNLKRMVFSTSVSPHWMKHSGRFWYSYETSEGEFYYIVDPARKSKKVLFDRDALAADMSRLTGDPFDGKHLSMENLKFIKNETAIRYEVKSKLVKEEEKDDDKDGDSQDSDKRKNKSPKKKDKIWFFEYNLSNGSLKLLEDYEKPDKDSDWATLSPDSTYVLFSRNHNLYWMDYENYVKAKKDEKDTTIVEHQWTEDGEENFSYGLDGRGETNVDKEKNKDKRKRVSVSFAPNSRKFALNRTDVRHIKDLWVINSVADPRPTLETYKYQMPGEKENPIEELKIFDFDTKESVKIKIEEFPDQTIRVLEARDLKKNRDDEHRPDFWLARNNDQVYFTRTSRDLKRIDICVADVKTGEVKVAVEERLNIYIDISNPTLVNGGKELIHWSERDGWGHLYLYDDQGNVKNQITKGPWHVNRVEEVDEKNRVIYFTANNREKGEDPYYTHLYRIKFDGSGLTLLDPG